MEQRNLQVGLAVALKRLSEWLELCLLAVLLLQDATDAVLEEVAFMVAEVLAAILQDRVEEEVEAAGPAFYLLRSPAAE